MDIDFITSYNKSKYNNINKAVKPTTCKNFMYGCNKDEIKDKFEKGLQMNHWKLLLCDQVGNVERALGVSSSLNALNYMTQNLVFA